MIYIAILYSSNHRLEEDFSQNLGFQCAKILTRVGQDHSLTRFRMINQALRGMPPEVVAEVRGLLCPVSVPRSQPRNLNFFQEPSQKRRRERDDSDEPEQKRKSVTNFSKA